MRITATDTTPSTDAELLAFVQQACPIVHRIGGAWFFADEVTTVGEHAGITDRFSLYAAGRGGVLGDCDPAVVATAFAFFPPPLVIARYRLAVAVHSPRACARVYAHGQAVWARRRFGGLDGLDRLAEMAFRIADSLRPMGLPLFAGWRAEPRPQDPSAAAALAMHVLRELRGDLHVQAVTAYRLSPLQAILGKDGSDRARELGYPEPYPPLSEFSDRRHAAEQLTDQMVAPAYAAIDAAEREDMLQLLNAMQDLL